MKTFYTERDIVDMYGAGIRQLEIDDEVVLTDLAREKAETLGISLISTEQPPPSTATATPSNSSDATLIANIKARVVARLDTSDYDDLLDQIIPQILAQVRAKR